MPDSNHFENESSRCRWLLMDIKICVEIVNEINLKILEKELLIELLFEVNLKNMTRLIE